MRGSPLERIALHQTRLRTPGLSLDPSGVALGARGLVLLPTVERLVAFLAIYTRERSFAELLSTPGSAQDRLEITLVRSALGTRELVVSFPATSTTLLDAVADVARLAGGATFTGAGRYWVQYRDRSAPFGYDVVELLRVDDAVDFALHHTSFTQAYSREREVDLAGLVIRLEPRRDPTATALAARPLWLVVEPGIAPALVAYLARGGIAAELGLAELPPETSLDDEPRRLVLVRLAELPPRLEQLVTRTPGITAYGPAGPGVAVEIGFRHAIGLLGLPVFPPEGLVLLPRPGPRRVPIVLPRLPELAPAQAFVDVKLGDAKLVRATPLAATEHFALALRLAPSVAAARAITATLVSIAQAPLLRRLAYALPSSAIETTSIARARLGGEDVLLLRAPAGAETIPLGAFFSERAPGLMVLAGHDLVPSCPPQHLARAVGASGEQLVYLYREAGDAQEALRAFTLPASAFVPLAEALVSPESWGALQPIEVAELAREELEARLGKAGTVQMEGIGVLPMRGVE